MQQASNCSALAGRNPVGATLDHTDEDALQEDAKSWVYLDSTPSTNPIPVLEGTSRSSSGSNTPEQQRLILRTPNLTKEPSIHAEDRLPPDQFLRALLTAPGSASAFGGPIGLTGVVGSGPGSESGDSLVTEVSEVTFITEQQSDHEDSVVTEEEHYNRLVNEVLREVAKAEGIDIKKQRSTAGRWRNALQQPGVQKKVAVGFVSTMAILGVLCLFGSGELRLGQRWKGLRRRLSRLTEGYITVVKNSAVLDAWPTPVLIPGPASAHAAHLLPVPANAEPLLDVGLWSEWSEWWNSCLSSGEMSDWGVAAAAWESAGEVFA